MSEPYSVSASWENRQGVHQATLRFKPYIETRPGCIGVSLSERLETTEQQDNGDTSLACIVLDRVLAVQFHYHLALVLEEPMVPASALREALELAVGMTRAASSPKTPNPSQWATYGEEIDRLTRYLPGPG